MFVRKDKDGNLVAVGSIDRNQLTQLQGKPKKAPTSVEPEPSSDAEPPATDEPKPAAVGPKAKSTPRP